MIICLCLVAVNRALVFGRFNRQVLNFSTLVSEWAVPLGVVGVVN